MDVHTSLFFHFGWKLGRIDHHIPAILNVFSTFPELEWTSSIQWCNMSPNYKIWHRWLGNIGNLEGNGPDLTSTIHFAGSLKLLHLQAANNEGCILWHNYNLIFVIVLSWAAPKGYDPLCHFLWDETLFSPSKPLERERCSIFYRSSWH